VIGLHSIDESRPQAGFTVAPNGSRSPPFLRFSCETVSSGISVAARRSLSS